MADVYSNVATIQNAPHVGDSFNNPQRAGGKVRVVQASYEAAALAANDVIRVCRLRKGDEVLMNSFVMFDDLGTGTTLDIGDDDPLDTGGAGDVDRYADGIDTAAAAAVFVFNDVTACIDKVPYTIQADCWLTAKNLGAAATGTLKFTIFIARAGA
jgi:hypothetical protein